MRADHRRGPRRFAVDERPRVEGLAPPQIDRLEGPWTRRLPTAALAFLVSVAGLAFAFSAFLGGPQPDRDGRSTGIGNGLITIAHGRDQDIALIDPASGDVTPLVDRHGGEPNTNTLEMAWSPDGSMLAYTDVRKNGLQGLFVLELATGESVDLSDGLSHADDPAWSTDGHRIAFGGADGTSGYEIYVTAPNGTERVRVTDHADDGVSGAHMPAWSPDGTRIAFAFNRYHSTTETESHGIGIVDASGSNDIAFTDGLDELPSWSPDGTRVAFHRRVDDKFELRIVAADGTRQQVVSREDVSVHWSAVSPWSPDGTWLLYSYHDLETSNLGLAATDVETGATQVLLEDAFVGLPVWSPDGARIAFVRDDADRPSPSVSLWVTSVDGATDVELADGLEHVSDVAWQPTSTHATPSPSTGPEPLPPQIRGSRRRSRSNQKAASAPSCTQRATSG
jgi:Tol biopolymer transport system component